MLTVAPLEGKSSNSYCQRSWVTFAIRGKKLRGDDCDDNAPFQMFSSSPSLLSFCRHTFFHLKTGQTQDSQQSEQSLTLSFRGIPSTPFVQVNTSKNIWFWMCIKVFMKFKFTKNIQKISVLTHETLSNAPAAQLCNDSPSKQRHKLNYLCLI